MNREKNQDAEKTRKEHHLYLSYMGTLAAVKSSLAPVFRNVP